MSGFHYCLEGPGLLFELFGFFICCKFSFYVECDPFYNFHHEIRKKNNNKNNY